MEIDEQTGETPWTHDQTVVNGVRLHYVTAGDDEDPLVIFLHGFPELWYSWRYQIPALADAGFQVVVPDMRGYNRSEKPTGIENYRMEKPVGDVAGLAEEFGDGTAYVVGHDWGGGVAWDTAIRRPDVVEKLIVMNAPHLGRFREVLANHPSHFLRSWYVLWFQVPWLPETLLKARNGAGIASLLEAYSKPDTFSDEELQRYRDAVSRPGALKAALNYYRALVRDAIKEDIGALRGEERPSRDVEVPTLVIWGEEDTTLGIELSEGLDKWVSDLRVERLSDASHWVQNDEPERVNDLIIDYFSADSAGSADTAGSADSASSSDSADDDRLDPVESN